MGGDTSADVYSYGVILLEMLCGRPPTDPYFSEIGVVDLVAWVNMKIEEGTMATALDERLDSSESRDEMVQLMKVALLCVEEEADSRPTMVEVVNMLTRAKETAARIRENPALRELLE